MTFAGKNLFYVGTDKHYQLSGFTHGRVYGIQQVKEPDIEPLYGNSVGERQSIVIDDDGQEQSFLDDELEYWFNDEPS